MNREEIITILEGIEKPVADHTGGSLEYDGPFICTLMASLAKNYELNRIIFDDENPINPLP